MLAPFECLCGNFILPEPASYVFFYVIFNLRKLLYIIRVWELVSTARESRAEELKKLAQMQKMWALRKPILDAHILSLQEKVQVLEQEIDEIVMEKIIHQT